jgi:hydrogenase expression/formation protein HypE
MQDTYISLAHGNGGRYMRELIHTLFTRYLHNSALNIQADAAQLSWSTKQLVITTDGFTVQPLEFAGGNIGSLAVHGTVNDLAVSGAIPRYLTLSLFIEEGFEIAMLERIIASLAETAKTLGVAVVTGDTKVLRRGEGGGLYLSMTGIGERVANAALGMQYIQSGDKILVSGAVGNHGIAVMLAREQFGLRGQLISDAASVLPLTQAIWDMSGVRFMRDPTRGGLATVAHEISLATQHTVHLQQSQIPVCEEVISVCEMLGYDPYYLACEGRVVAVVAPECADSVLSQWQALPQGHLAAVIGEIQLGKPRVILHTPLGGARLLEELEDDPLPRIC